MGEPSDIKAGGAIPAEDHGMATAAQDDGAFRAVDEEPKGNWIRLHWRGELSLGISFWLNGFILNGVLLLLDRGLDRLLDGNPELLYELVGVAMWAFMVAVTIWQIVGIWRSAGRFPGRRLADGRYVGRRLWSITARVVTVVWSLRLLALLAPLVAAFR